LTSDTTIAHAAPRPTVVNNFFDSRTMILLGTQADWHLNECKSIV